MLRVLSKRIKEEKKRKNNGEKRRIKGSIFEKT
jgi:hypothetical protein